MSAETARGNGEPVFLATTGLQEFWDTDRRILFLGPWCLRGDGIDGCSQLKWEVHPSPWEDRERRHKSFAYVEQCYERALRRLAEYLNTVQGFSAGLHYYRILLGPWLRFYIHTLYDRYVLLTDVLKQHSSLTTVLLGRESYQIPLDVVDFLRGIGTDRYNLQVISEILESLGYDFPRKNLTPPRPRPPRSRPMERVRAAPWRLRRWVYRRALEVGQQRADVGIVAGGFSFRELAMLARRTRLRVLPIHVAALPHYVIDASHRSRQGLVDIGADDEFEQILAASLPNNYPGRYLEGLTGARAYATRRLGRGLPRAIFSNSIGFSRDPARFLIAEASERGASIIGGQHGGGYGMDRYHVHEEIEQACADRYYVWGWADAASEKARDLPSPKLSQVRQRRWRGVGPRPRDEILLVVTGQPRYAVKFWSGPVSREWEAYREWQARFISSLSAVLQDTLIVRPPPLSRGYASEVRRQIRSDVGDVCFDDGADFGSSLANCRVAVVDYPSTSFLEALVSGTPTVSFWDPSVWETRPAAKPYLDRLREVEALWDSPEGAALKVESIYEDPAGWWEAPSTIHGRSEFTNRFALTDPEWANAWGEALLSEVAPPQGRGPDS